MTDADRVRRNQDDLRFGERFDDSRTRLVHEDAERQLFLMASDQSICLVVEQQADAGGSTTCTDVGTAASGTVLTSAVGGEGRRWQVNSIVPDDVTDIAITTEEGSVAASAKRNALHGDLASKPIAIRWTTRDGSDRSMRFRGLDG